MIRLCHLYFQLLCIIITTSTSSTTIFKNNSVFTVAAFSISHGGYLIGISSSQKKSCTSTSSTQCRMTFTDNTNNNHSNNHNNNKFIDVDFTRYDDDDDDDGEKKRKIENEKMESILLKDSTKLFESNSNNSLLFQSLQMDPDWQDIAIEFIDPSSANSSSSRRKYIDCHLAFMMEMDGVSYAIGTPCETQVAIFCEGDENYFMDPDADENVELMEMAAAAFYKEFGEKTGITFKRTPRTLTVHGDLQSITDKMRDTTTFHQYLGTNSNNFLKKQTKSDVEKDDAFLDDFFTRELGANYKEEFLLDDKNYDGQDDPMDKEVQSLMELFNIPGIGDQYDDDAGIASLIDEVLSDDIHESTTSTKVQSNNNNPPSPVDTAMRLVAFKGPDEKYYSLVQLLQPIILVAKQDTNLEISQRMLLSPEEANYITPLLEEKFKKELERSGISLSP
mmetsp:Transcript_12730/g.18130  ORF Transcript_12730/g.18130 Transcript_12730/m.18130 type:complete len:448 (-) Transcript_12730:36-1379(-)